ncbi:ETX/MTX2 family pore-forming toxin [Microbacterium proteolyticum]
MLLAVPAGTVLATAPAAAAVSEGDPKIEEALKNAPELKGATFDVSRVTLVPGEMTAENGTFTPSGRKVFFDHSLANPINPEDRDQPPLTLTSVSQSWTHTDKTVFTRQNSFGTSLTLGMTSKAKVEIKGIFSSESDFKREITVSYNYTDQQSTWTEDSVTVTSSAQSAQVRPGHKVRIQQWVDIGDYEADLTLHATLQGNVVIYRCGTSVSVPIGRLAAMTRDPGQGPLFPGAKPDGDVLRLTSSVHWKANLASSARTEVTDSVLPVATPAPTAPSPTPSPTTASPTASPTPTASASPTAAPHARKAARAGAFVPTAVGTSGKPQLLRDVIACTTPSQFVNWESTPREAQPLTPGATAVGSRLFLTAENTLTYTFNYRNADNRVIETNVASVVGGQSYGNEWTTLVRKDGQAYSWHLRDNDVFKWTEGKWPKGTRAVGFHAYLTPAKDLYYKNVLIAQNVTSATGGRMNFDETWLTFVSNGAGYMWSGAFSPQDLPPGTTPSAKPTLEDQVPAGTKAVGAHAYLLPDGSLKYRNSVIATGVTSALGGTMGDSWHSWLSYISNGTAYTYHPWLSSPQTNAYFLPKGTKVVGLKSYLSPKGSLYSNSREVARNVTSANGIGESEELITFTRKAD